MKTKKIIFKSALLLMSFGVISCSDDFLDVNDNPNDPPISTPRLTLPVAQEYFADLNGTTMTYLGNFIVYNWSVPSDWQVNTDLIKYNVTSNFYTSIFETSYVSIFKNLNYVENYEDPTGAVDYSAYDAIAETVKGFQYEMLVDLYGDIPYTEANQRGENPTPVYDDAETVYKSVIDSLTMAASTALNLPENAENPGDQDIIFYGDMTSWAQFANTIKLRMLVRLSNTAQDGYIQGQISSINANGAGYIDDNVAANPGYSDDAGKQSPFFGYLGTAPGGVAQDPFDFTVATDYAITTLESYNDPRLESLYTEAVNGGYKGAPQITALPGTGFTTKDLSHVGPGLLESSEQDQPIMLLSEALFIQAEAMVRKYIPGGEAGAKEMYEAAIASSFEYLGAQVLADHDDNPETPMIMVDADPAVYYTQPIPNVSWDASPNKIEAIITQKWIALNGTASIQSWIDLTRTGFPDDLPIPAESDGVRPVRLLYPLSEIGRNEENVPDQTVQDAFTNYPFWK